MKEILSADEERILYTAAWRAAEILGISSSSLARMLGIEEATSAGFLSEDATIRPGKTEWKSVVLFIAIFDALLSMVGSEEKAKAWLDLENKALGDKPVNVLERNGGINIVHDYLQQFCVRS